MRQYTEMIDYMLEGGGAIIGSFTVTKMHDSEIRCMVAIGDKQNLPVMECANGFVIMNAVKFRIVLANTVVSM